MSSVRFSRRALRDLDEIAEYLLVRNPTAAARFAGVVNDLAEILRSHPYLGAETRGEHRARSWLIAGFPYRLHYTITQGELLVLHVRHTARRPWTEKVP